MTATFKDNIRKRLASMEEELLQSIANQHQEYEDLTLGDRTEETDEASIRNDERALSTLLRYEETQLLRVRSALGRIMDGHYGVCAMCGSEIDEARLDAKPEAVFCYPCATRRDRGARHAHAN
ncbi:MAG: TraR/DksA family transcriptional regulator [Spirochaetota bacterium]